MDYWGKGELQWCITHWRIYHKYSDLQYLAWYIPWYVLRLYCDYISHFSVSKQKILTTRLQLLKT